MTPAEQATIVIAALALRLVDDLVTEQLGAEGSLAALTIARSEDAPAQRPVLDLARQLIAVLDGHFTRVAPLAPSARFGVRIGPFVGRPRLQVAYREADHYIAQLEQQLREQTDRLTAARDLLSLAQDTIAHLEHGLAVTLEKLRGGDVDAGLHHGEEVLRGTAR